MAVATADLIESVTKVVSWIPYPIAASTQIWQYELVCVNSSGYLVPASNTSGLIFAGYSITPGAQANNLGGANGAFNVSVIPAGVGPDSIYYIMTASGATQSWVGSVVYFTDNATVALTATNSVKMGSVAQYISSTSVLVRAAPTI
jgi:hypothetical protein